MEAKLVVVGGKANMGEVKLRLPMTIGRGNKADLIISHPTVSRIHCKLSEVDGLLVIRDNSSSNGTFVDDEQVTESVVRPGQKVKIGPITFRAEYEIAEVLPPEPAQAGGAMAETQSIDRDEFDFLADDMFTDAPAEEKTAPAAKLPEKAKPKPEAKPKEQPVEAKKKPSAASAPAKPAKQEPPKVAEETAYFEQAPAVEETTADKDDGLSMFDEIEASASVPTVEMPAEPAAAPANDLDFDFLSDLNFDDAAKEEPPAVPSPPEASAVAPAAKKPEPTAEPEAVPAEPPIAEAPAPAIAPSEKVSADDFDFLSELDDAPVAESPAIEPPAETETPAAKQAEPKFFEPKPTEPAASFDFTGDLGVAESKPFEMPHIPVEEEPAAEMPVIETPTSEAPPEKVSADDFDFLSELDDAPAAESPVIEPPAETAEPETPVVETKEPKLFEPKPTEPAVSFDFTGDLGVSESKPFHMPHIPAAETPAEKVSADEFDFLGELDSAPAEAPAVKPKLEVEDVAPSTPVEEPVVNKTSSTEDLDLMFDFDEAASASPPTAEPPAAPVVEEPQWPAAAETSAAAEPSFDFEEELAASAPPSATPFTPDAEAPAPEPVAEWPAVEETPAEVAPPAEPAKSAADEFDFLGLDETSPAAESPVAAAPHIDVAPPEGQAESLFDELAMMEGAPRAESIGPKFSEPTPTAPAAAFDFTGDLGLSEEPQHFEMPKETAAESLAFDFTSDAASPAAAASPTGEPEMPAFAPETEAPAFAPSAAAPIAKKSSAAPAAAPKMSFIDKLKKLLGLGGPKKKSSGAKKSASAGLEATAAAAAAPIAVPKFGPRPLDDTPIPLAEDAPIPLFGDEPAAAAPGVEDLAPSTSEPVAAAPHIDVAPPEGQAESLFDELAMMEGAPSAESIGPKFSEPAPTTPAAAFDFTGDLGIAESKPFAMPHHAAAAEPPAAATSSEAGDFIDELFGLDEPAAPPTPVAEAPAVEPPAPAAEPPAVPTAAAAAPIAESGAEAKSEVEDLFASFASEEPAASEPAQNGFAASEPSAEEPAGEVTARDESAFGELFAPGDEPELAGSEPAAAAPDIESNFAESGFVAPNVAADAEPVSPFAWDEPAPAAGLQAETAEAVPLPIGAELVAPIPGFVEEPAVAAEPVALGSTRPYVIDVDVRHTYLNRLAVRIASKMSQLDIPDLEPEMPAGRSFNRIGKPPVTEEPVMGEAASALAGAEFVGAEPPTFDSWDEPAVAATEMEPIAPPAESMSFDVPASSPSEPVEMEFDAAALFGEEPPMDASNEPIASSSPETDGLTGMFAAESPPIEEASPFAEWVPQEEPASPTAEAVAPQDEPKHPIPTKQQPNATPPAKAAGKDDDLDSFLNDLGMG